MKQDVNVCIYDGNENKVYNENVNTSEYGIISGNFTLANEVNSGIYKIVIKTSTNETTKSFKVDPYVTPKFEVKINLDKQNYLVGDTAKINLNAKYFFGEAVSQAKYKIYINDEQYRTITADNEGNASLEYKIEEEKTYKIKAEVTDTSNYYTETTCDFVASKDIFKVEAIPEYGKLVTGQNNDIYVFTSNPDGTPLKTYVTISSGEYKKQIATDENGIGKFSINSTYLTKLQTASNNSKKQETQNTKNSKTLKIKAENMNGEAVEIEKNFEVENKTILISTDKVKYGQGEDIKINISSELDKNKNIYVFKNNKLIKMVSTNSEETDINLGDEYGIIDIYVTQKSNQSNYTNNVNSYKKTIFIKPTKKLNINVKTDKQEYTPGENIGLEFNTTDENNNNIDSALLVSMLDNSVLNIANNDLSIDNIKLALSDLSFSNEMDGATLYSCIVDDKSEQTMMALLLKQGDRSTDVSESIINNSDVREKSAIISVISIIIIIVIVIAFISIKFPKCRKFIKHLINVIVYIPVIVASIMCIANKLGEPVDRWILAFTVIVSLTVYISWISSIYKIIFRTSISIILSLILGVIITIIVNSFEINIMKICIIIALIVLILIIINKISETKKFKLDKYIKMVVKEIIYIGKYLVTLIISIILGMSIEGLIDIKGIFIPISIIMIYIINYILNITHKEKDLDKKKGISLENIVIGIIIIIIILFILHPPKRHPTIDPRNDVEPIDGGYTVSSGMGTSGDLSSIIENATDIISDENNSYKQSNETTTENKDTKESENTTETVDDDNIRNVFLESMCFVPELVTNNGNAKLDLKLSDNITTWTIQTVGNTKDGKIGYSSLDNVKIFKEFFTDFELPKNIVESDKISIPVTVYNYTENSLNATLNIKEDEWFTLQNNNNININVDAGSSKMVYIPITILKNGDYKFRVEVSNGSLSDIVEKEVTIVPNGYKVEKVVSTGSLEKNVSEDILIMQDFVENTASAKVKIYANTISQTIEGIENIFRMPTGCFEQISSSLYPNILALKYLQDNGISNEELKTKAKNYISSGYQKLLTYEVPGESGGYSLYGTSPAETVLTAYGLMELTDLKQVYNVDQAVLDKMTNFLYGKQQSNGTFTITGSHIGGAGSRENLALNAYIIWALSESDPHNSNLSKSVDYIKGKLDNIDDNYTLALVANILANVEDKEAENVVKRLENNVNMNNDYGYVTSIIKDYYGSKSTCQTIQTTALTSMAITKVKNESKIQKSLTNYLISQRDSGGTWYSTQATILALKALNIAQQKNKLENQTISVNVNSNEQRIEIKDNPLEYYELKFDNLQKENKLNINCEKSGAYYEVVEEYYVPYEKVDKSQDNIEVTVDANNNLGVNELLNTHIKAINKSQDSIENGMITINIPQGFVVLEESLSQLENKGIIEKYETTYSTINIYLRSFEADQIVDLDINFRASYPVEITGLGVKAYDYYNPEIEGKSLPISIKVTE